jgi:GH15 family glucan-1,4-alpha-glucosidase
MERKAAMSEGSTYPPIADYGLIGDMHSCALVSKAGSIDWCCFPRFDSASVFGRILDWERGGYFLLAPRGIRSVTRRYLPGTNVLETTFETEEGRARLIDFMPVDRPEGSSDPDAVIAHHQVVRLLECLEGTVEARLECEPRFDYGSIVPHAVLMDEYSGFAHGGADGIALFSTAPLSLREGGFEASAHLRPGDILSGAITYESKFGHHVEPRSVDELTGYLDETLAFWREWCFGCEYEGEFEEQVVRSALTLKALTYAPTGALVAAPTTSLPEAIGGRRNWDYRFGWIRDTAFAVYALSQLGMEREATHFKNWLEWSATGRASDLQVMYGLAGERRLDEIPLAWLEGYRGSYPVRTGNAASTQFQLDIYGELMDVFHLYRKSGGAVDAEYWEFLRDVVEYVVSHWREPDEGIWEERSERKHHVFSKVLCWVALDRGVRAAEALELRGDVERWRRVRREIREDILAHGYDAERGSFVGAYGSKHLDASLLMLPLFKFISVDDPRMRSTIRAIERELTSEDGFVYRYRHDYDDGVGGPEGTFHICTFWLCDNLILLGELDRARDLFRRLSAASNDLGLFSEQHDPERGMLGNFPQAFSHLGQINAAVQLTRAARGEAPATRGELPSRLPGDP